VRSKSEVEAFFRRWRVGGSRTSEERFTTQGGLGKGEAEEGVKEEELGYNKESL